MKRSILAVLALVASMLPLAAHASSSVRVGVGIADDTWHVGAGSGQYAAKSPNALGLATGSETDPFNHGLIQQHSYGVQSRLSFRAIVVEGNNGNRIAFVKTDHYLAQDALTRRVAQILDAKGTSGIHYNDIMLMATHNHSSPYYATPSWGVWLFQDAFEIRAFEYEARQMALSIELAAADLQPARVGATVTKHYIYKGQIARYSAGDDGSPAGYPETKIDAAGNVTPGHGDFGLTVVRFDNADTNRPIAVLANFGEHPESNNGYDLMTADFLGPLQRDVERETGAPLVWSQGDVGSSEGPYFDYNATARTTSSDVLPDGVVRAWAHTAHAQTERGARYLANDIVKAWRQIGDGDQSVTVPLSDNFPVYAGSAFVPGPVSHPYPSVSNCRTEPTSQGNYGSPILGLPDCERVKSATGQKGPDSMVYDLLKQQGIPVPENYDAPAFTGVEENMRIHLQAFRMGEVLFASCSCEAQMDLILNLESRLDNTVGNIFDGYEYPCIANTNGTWTCRSGSLLQQTVTITDAKHARMLAEIHNDAKGWDDPGYAAQANGEPTDPSLIKGNFTKEELSTSLGYALPVGLGHAGDYDGYTVSYREYMIRDHYRKALTSYGPHTADYMVTNLVRLAASLRDGGPPMPVNVLDPAAKVDEARETAFMVALGAASANAYDTWLASLPNDAGTPGALVQPKDITRFGAATFTWRGGSNAVDNPVAKVQRQVGGAWVDFADQTGEVQTMVKFPVGTQGVVDAYASAHEWRWTANFEAFDAFPRATLSLSSAGAVLNGQTPGGIYRFVVDGASRSGLVAAPYHLASAPFEVTAWGGITPSDPVRGSGGSVSFKIANAYPRTYTGSPFRYISDDGNPILCKTCSFRPWASKGALRPVTVHVVRADTTTQDIPATLSAGRWVAATNLQPGDTASIAPGSITDDFGEYNATGLTF